MAAGEACYAAFVADHWGSGMKHLAALIVLIMCGLAAWQSASPQNPASSPQSQPEFRPQSTPDTPAASNADFAQIDEVLGEMSVILHLPVKQPLRKSLRSKEQIRAYLTRKDKEGRTDAQRYADTKALEAFGLISRGFDYDSFMLDFLSDHVAGLYNSRAKEFYVANWIPIDEQREAMSHGLAQALEDQSFNIDPWIKAASPNDDAEAARQAASQGTALAAMVDYALRDQKISVRDLADVTTLIRPGAINEIDKDPKLLKAPAFIRDSLAFPWLAGAAFAQAFLKAHTGWADLHLLFERPPVSTQQIMQPNLYLEDVHPAKVTLPEWEGLVPADWKLLEENVLGEFRLDETLRQFIGATRADALSPVWNGDRYAVFENAKKETPLVLRVALDTHEDSKLFFRQYSDVLATKYANRTQMYRGPYDEQYFQFQTVTGGVFLRCMKLECLAIEGATRKTFDAINRAIGWPPAPDIEEVPQEVPKSIVKADRMAPSTTRNSLLAASIR